jgi:hypothetical protein
VSATVYTLSNRRDEVSTGRDEVPATGDALLGDWRTIAYAMSGTIDPLSDGGDAVSVGADGMSGH